jgi:hypothetical protein
VPEASAPASLRMAMFWLLLAPGMELAELRLVTRATGRLGEATGPGPVRSQGQGQPKAEDRWVWSALPTTPGEHHGVWKP